MTPILPFLNQDARILKELRSGNDSVLADLYESNRRMIGVFVQRNHGTGDDADDLLQEAVIILWERVRAGTFVYESKLSTFLFGVVKNLWSGRLRRLRREVPAEADTPEVRDDALLPDEILEENEQTEFVRKALERIGMQCRKLLLLFYWEERSTEEIARELGFANADTVKSKKYQCKKALEEVMKGMTA